MKPLHECHKYNSNIWSTCAASPNSAWSLAQWAPWMTEALVRHMAQRCVLSMVEICFWEDSRSGFLFSVRQEPCCQEYRSPHNLIVKIGRIFMLTIHKTVTPLYHV